MNLKVKLILLALTTALTFAGSQSAAYAQVCDATTVGQCISGRVCVAQPNDQTGEDEYGLGANCGGSAVIGRVIRPTAYNPYNYEASGDYHGIGIIAFTSRILNILTIIAGIWVMFNFIYAGLIYITSSGDPQAHTRVVEKLTYSGIGILVVALAYTIAALIGLILFGDAGFILNPTPVTIYELSP